mgnify:CR=1 FL=1
MSVAEVGQEQELLAIIGDIDWANSRMVAELFHVLKDWWAERGNHGLSCTWSVRRWR